MKILFLDDDTKRHIRFMQARVGQDITYVWTAEEAIEALRSKQFDAAFLDHDLGGVALQMELPETGSGYDVACFIAKLPPDKRPWNVVLHSFNPAGVTRMRAALVEGGYDAMQIHVRPFDY